MHLTGRFVELEVALRSGQVRAFEVGVFEAGAFEVGALEVSFTEITIDVRPEEVVNVSPNVRRF